RPISLKCLKISKRSQIPPICSSPLPSNSNNKKQERLRSRRLGMSSSRSFREKPYSVRLSGERYPQISCDLNEVAVGRHVLNSGDGGCNIEGFELALAQRDHLAVLAFGHKMHRRYAQGGSKEPIDRSGSTAALQVPEHNGPRVFLEQ